MTSAKREGSVSTTSTSPRLRRLVYWLEDCFRLPGTSWRFGWEPIVGFVLPGAGDVIGLLLGVPIVWTALVRRHPWRVLLVMIVNLVLDATLGTVPVAGDLFDAAWKAQRKNLQLLDDPASLRAVLVEARGKAGWLLAGLLGLVVLWVLCLMALVWLAERLI